MPGIIKFSKNEIPEDEAIAAKKASISNPNSRVVFDFVNKVNRLIRKRILKDKMNDRWFDGSKAEIGDNGNFVYINYYEPVSEKDGYVDEGCSNNDKYDCESLIFIFKTLRSWNPDGVAGFHSYVTDYQLSHSMKMNKREAEEYNEQMKNSPTFDENAGYTRKLMVEDVCNFEDVDVAYSSPTEEEEEEGNEFYNFREGLERLRDKFEGSRIDIKTLLCQYAIEFLRVGYSEQHVIEEFLKSCFSEVLDICDMISKYHAYELPEGQFIAKYLSKSAPAVARTLNTAYKKLEKVKTAAHDAADDKATPSKRKTNRSKQK